jgi:hypothetical protein
VVVTAGETFTFPLGNATGPIPLSMVSDVAFCVDQFSATGLLGTVMAGVAVNVSVGNTCCTVMVTLAVAFNPVGPMAVSTYVVVVAGVTGRELAVENGVSAGSVRGSGEMLTVVVFVADHVMVEIEPAVMVVGDAVNVIAGGSGALTVTVTFEVVLPPGPVAVSV